MILFQRFKSSGFTMIEVMITLFIIGLTVAPILSIISASSKQTQTSTSYTLSVQYADEIAQQIFRLAPVFDLITAEAGKESIDYQPSLLDILRDQKFNENLAKSDNFFRLVPFNYKSRELGAFLVLSPLERHFTGRSIEVFELASEGVQHLNQSKFLKILVHLEWQDFPSLIKQKTVYAFIVRES